MANVAQVDVPGTSSLLTTREAQGWQSLASALHQRAFLRSEGSVTSLGEPRLVRGELLDKCEKVAESFWQFYQQATETFLGRTKAFGRI